MVSAVALAFRRHFWSINTLYKHSSRSLACCSLLKCAAPDSLCLGELEMGCASTALEFSLCLGQVSACRWAAQRNEVYNCRPCLKLHFLVCLSANKQTAAVHMTAKWVARGENLLCDLWSFCGSTQRLHSGHTKRRKAVPQSPASRRWQSGESPPRHNPGEPEIHASTVSVCLSPVLLSSSAGSREKINTRCSVNLPLQQPRLNWPKQRALNRCGCACAIMELTWHDGARRLRPQRVWE